jgi:putative methionine-R-sulfoxide reductase with GAF domain
MSAIIQSPRPVTANRRRRVRHKVHAPAYATFSGASQSEMLDLYEVVDISEVGVAVQCPLPLKIDQGVDLCLDLAEARGQISVAARVVWSEPDGKVGLGFPALPDSDQRRLREWLFLNAMAGAANAASSGRFPSTTVSISESRPDYSDTLGATSAVQREAESLGADLETVLSFIVSRAQSLLDASGAAIALAGKDAAAMICRASSGPSAPPVGAALRIGSGFSGDCVRAGKTLRCDDTDNDERVDPEICRALGIRSMLASPIRPNQQDKVIGLLEVFSERPNAFDDNDAAILQRLAETIFTAVKRAVPPDDPSVSPPPSAIPFSPAPDSVLFAHYRGATNDNEAPADPDSVGGVRLPRTHLYLLLLTAATLALAVGFISAPWIQPWIQAKVQARERNGESTVLASSPPTIQSAQSALQKSSVDSSNLAQLRELAQQGNPAAENAMGLLYAQGDDKQAIKQDETEAVRWFTNAAEHGSVPAQYKLGLMLWGGRGVPKDTKKAYFWAVLARAGGQEGGKDLATLLANGMTRSQAAAIEQQAEMWYQQHESGGKPKPGR